MRENASPQAGESVGWISCKRNPTGVASGSVIAHFVLLDYAFGYRKVGPIQPTDHRCQIRQTGPTVQAHVANLLGHAASFAVCCQDSLTTKTRLTMLTLGSTHNPLRHSLYWTFVHQDYALSEWFDE